MLARALKKTAASGPPGPTGRAQARRLTAHGRKIGAFGPGRVWPCNSRGALKAELLPVLWGLCSVNSSLLPFPLPTARKPLPYTRSWSLALPSLQTLVHTHNFGSPMWPAAPAAHKKSSSLVPLTQDYSLPSEQPRPATPEDPEDREEAVSTSTRSPSPAKLARRSSKGQRLYDG